MVLDCRCKAISNVHTKAAQAAALDVGSPTVTAETLYASALAFKRADPSAKISGLEDHNGDGDVCRRCRETFGAAASAVIEQITSRRRVIPLALSGGKPAIIGSCGKDCNTCAKATSGCAPVVA